MDLATIAFVWQRRGRSVKVQWNPISADCCDNGWSSSFVGIIWQLGRSPRMSAIACYQKKSKCLSRTKPLSLKSQLGLCSEPLLITLFTSEMRFAIIDDKHKLKYKPGKWVEPNHRRPHGRSSCPFRARTMRPQQGGYVCLRGKAFDHLTG